ncbi:hypothetical protein BD414DRAFT_474525 [Trametes punicea]|nr:hypothetical protein BD414DRAFT_474525 [Trametes punicea]
MQSEILGWADSAPQPDTHPAVIVVTAPSPTDESPKVQQSPLSSLSPQSPEVLTLSDVISSAPIHLHVPPVAKSPPTTAHSTPMLTFEERLSAENLSDPGPQYFHRRRSLWCSPIEKAPCPTPPSAPRRRLEDLLAVPGAIENDETWNAGLYGVWCGLVRGDRLKHRLPLALVIKILQAGWIREGTWPRGAVVPESDEDLDNPAARYQEQPFGLSTVTTPAEYTPIVTTPASAGTPDGTLLANDIVLKDAS